MKNKSLIIGTLAVLLIGGVIYCFLKYQNDYVGSLIIPEFGVSIPLISEIDDLVYGPHKEFRGVYGLSTQSLMDAVEAEVDGDCSPAGSALGFLGTVTTGEKLYESTIVVKLAEGSYLHWTHPQDHCADNVEVQALQSAQLELVQDAVKKAYRN